MKDKQNSNMMNYNINNLNWLLRIKIKPENSLNEK